MTDKAEILQIVKERDPEIIFNQLKHGELEPIEYYAYITAAAGLVDDLMQLIVKLKEDNQK